ncbi:replication initiator protein [Flyfo microvirus Tbat2_185]|nr:replication initiator protein [Flyfo microvirus Tbat2_185]
MRCYSPIHLKPKHGASRISVPCGKCIPCLSAKRDEWSTRIMEEAKTSEHSLFLTITYSDEHLPFDEKGLPSLNKVDLQNFFKRLRKKYSSFKSMKYYAVGEYGSTTQRPHYHVILFHTPFKYTPRIGQLNILEAIWGKGFVDVGNVEEASAAYVAKYCITKQNEVDSVVPPFALISKGLGAGYITETTREYHRADPAERNCITLSGGRKKRLPRYYKDKIFDKSHKKKIAKALELLSDINALDTREAFVNQKQNIEDYLHFKTQKIQKPSKL